MSCRRRYAAMYQVKTIGAPNNIVTDYRNKNGPALTSADAEPLLFYFSSGFVKSNPSVNGLIGLMVEMACL